MFRFSNDRAGLTYGIGLVKVSALSLAFGICLTGCPKPPPPVVVPPPPPPGDTMRLAGKAGDKQGGNVKVRLDEDAGGKKPAVFAFQLEEEHVVETASPEGNMHVTAKFFNVEAQGDTPKEKKAGDAMARALSEIQIAYDISNRGDVTNFEVKNVPDKYMSKARLIAAWVYGAEHGPLFDPGPVESGKGWQVRAQVPIPSGGNKNWEVSCTYAKKEKGIATLNVEGKVAGESQGTQLSGELKSEIRVDLGRGVLVYQDVDSTSTFKSDNGSQQIHVHVNWEAQAPAASGGGAAQQSGGDAKPAQEAPASK